MLTAPARKPPNQAAKSTAGKNVMNGTVVAPMSGVKAIRRSAAARTATTAALYRTSCDLSFARASTLSEGCSKTALPLSRGCFEVAVGPSEAIELRLFDLTVYLIVRLGRSKLERLVPLQPQARWVPLDERFFRLTTLYSWNLDDGSVFSSYRG